MMIETNRLILREMNENDFCALYKVLGDSDISRHYPYNFDENRVKNWISKNIKRYEIFGFGLFAVCLKETNEMIGDCGLTMQNIDNMICPEIGYHIRKICNITVMRRKRRPPLEIGRLKAPLFAGCFPI